MSDIVVLPGDPRDPPVRALLEASQALMRSLFPSEANHYLDVDALCAPQIHFMVASQNGVPVGCAALAQREGYGEIKSMFVAEASRRSGAGSALIEAVENTAKALDIGLLRLETGNSLTSAHRLYQRHGFTLRDRFGDYADSPYSLFMEKTL